MNETLCSCGCGLGAKHILGKDNCYRKEAIGNLIPTNFRKEKMIESWKEPFEICDVNGSWLTVWTLENQRGYHLHDNGKWSLPKTEDSLISIGENW